MPIVETRRHPMLVEVTGSLGSGKSVFARLLERDLSARGLRVRLLRAGERPAIDRATIPWSPRFAARNPALLSLMVKAIVRDGDSALARAALLRAVARRTGMSERMVRWRSEFDVVVWDEGMLHLAHNAFAHIESPPRHAEVRRFGELIPKPDVLVRLRTTPATATRRVTLRGHQRTAGDPAAVAALFGHAETVFQWLSEVREVEERKVELENDFADVRQLAGGVASISARVADRAGRGTK